MMKSHYDFSKGERGKFYRPDEALSVPVYLDPQVRKDLDALLQNDNRDFDSFVNELLRRDIESLRALRSNEQ